MAIVCYCLDDGLGEGLDHSLISFTTRPIRNDNTSFESLFWKSYRCLSVPLIDVWRFSKVFFKVLKKSQWGRSYRPTLGLMVWYGGGILLACTVSLDGTWDCQRLIGSICQSRLWWMQMQVASLVPTYMNTEAERPEFRAACNKRMHRLFQSSIVFHCLTLKTNTKFNWFPSVGMDNDEQDVEEHIHHVDYIHHVLVRRIGLALMNAFQWFN